MHFYFLLLRIC